VNIVTPLILVQIRLNKVYLPHLNADTMPLYNPFLIKIIHYLIGISSCLIGTSSLLSYPWDVMSFLIQSPKILKNSWNNLQFDLLLFTGLNPILLKYIIMFRLKLLNFLIIVTLSLEDMEGSHLKVFIIKLHYFLLILLNFIL
jgi:hypothetical protein